MKALLFAATLILCACAQATEPALPFDWRSAEVEPFVLYGRDNRVEIAKTRIPNVQELAAATAALIDAPNLVQRKESVRINADSVQKTFELCSSERFSRQTAAAFCSGVLVGPDLLLTAGHCIADSGACYDTSIVFDYRLQNSTGRANAVPKSSIYRCKKIEASDENPHGEFTLIRLDRKVVGREPVAIRSSPARIGNQVIVLGHPLGTPLKITGPSKILELGVNTFLTNSDTYTGNSGSPVFNLQTKRLEGILSSGQDDFDWNGACRISRVCKGNACAGEQATDALRFYEDVRRHL